MTTATVLGEAAINGSTFYPAVIEFSADVEHIRSEDATRPDPAWEHTDSNGHFHAFADGEERLRTPTLETYLVHVDCDGSCGGPRQCPFA